MSQQYSEKVVLVTGAGAGIGKAIATAFAHRDAKVVVAARTLSRGKALVAALQQAGLEAMAVQADNSDRAAMKAMIQAAIDSYGRLDIVVHCAAEFIQGEVLDMDEADFDAMLSSNIQSLFWLARDAAPYLSQAPDKGRLIYISSGSVNRQYVPGLICYTATKAYMDFFARGLAMEFGKHNILVNVVEPGLIASDRVNANISEPVLNALTSSYPIARPGQPQDIASAVLFLASQEAAYMTGASLLVDGGSSMAPMPDLDKILAGA